MSSMFYDVPDHPNISLPNEVLSQIFTNLSPPILADLARVSHRFNGVAEHILYSSIFIRDTLSESSPHPWRTRNCCHSILRRAHLIQSMRGFHIRWQKDPQAPPPRLNHLPASTKLAEALRSLVALESLELWLGPANTDAPPGALHSIEWIVRGCHFPQLSHCSLGAEMTKHSPAYSGILDTFLSSLSSLRHLKLLDHHAPLNIPPDALPSLTSFRGSPDTSAFLLPGRPVQFLSLVGQDSDINRENLPRFAQTTLSLRYLDLSAMSVRPILLRNIAAYLPTIEVLKIRLALRHTLHYALSGIRLLAGLSSVLNTFHRLIYLDLSPTSVAGADLEQELGLCTEWCRACPSLRKIVFPSHTEWLLDPEGVWVPVGRI